MKLQVGGTDNVAFRRSTEVVDIRLQQTLVSQSTML